jgi:integrase
LQRITPHECRHSFASIAIAAGVNIGTVSAALGHASVTITWDRYHHLLPGTMDQAADLIPADVSAAR